MCFTVLGLGTQFPYKPYMSERPKKYDFAVRPKNSVSKLLTLHYSCLSVFIVEMSAGTTSLEKLVRS